MEFSSSDVLVFRMPMEWFMLGDQLFIACCHGIEAALEVDNCRSKAGVDDWKM